MKILVTGAHGFIGKNLIAELKNRKYSDIFEYDIETEPEMLEKYCQQAEFVFHLAGVNRPQNQAEFMTGNFGFTSTLLETLKKYKNACPVMISSSIQAELNNPYGESKRAGEELMFHVC
jgi:UDP-2-acetamido-2,6-beta-L-arabino-hexul-4-ose reductase